MSASATEPVTRANPGEGSPARAWVPDILDGFEQTTLEGAAAAAVPSVLVRRRAEGSTRTAVLYLHGFVDYFFQDHVVQ